MIDDLRAAIRHLRRRPGFLLLGAGALGLGLAAAILVFGLLNTLMLRPLPGISKETRQVEIGRLDADDRFGAVSFPDFMDVRDHSETIERVFAYRMGPAYLDGGDVPVGALSMLVSGHYFAAMGVQPALGQLIGPEQDATPGREPVVVLSYPAFERYFGADPAAIGQSLHVNGSEFTVIGVTSREFRGHIAPIAPELYLPLSMAAAMQVRDDVSRYERGSNWLEMGGVLREGVSLDQAKAELAALSTALEERRAAYQEPWQFGVVELRPLPQRAHGMIRFLSWGLMLMCGAILALASINLAGVLIAKGEARAAELATRAVLGASRARIVRQLFLESVLVALAACGIGLGLATFGRDLLHLVPLPLPFAVDLGIVIDARVTLFALGASALIAVGFGLLPAIRVSSVAPGRAIGSARTATGSREKLAGRSILLAAQSALTVLLLLVSAFTMLALGRAADVDTGFRTTDVQIAHLDMAPLGLGGEATAQRLELLSERLRRRPGVDAVGFAAIVPLTGEQLGYGSARLPGAGDEERVDLRVNVVGAGFFDVFQIPVRGRGPGSADRPDGVQVAVINERLADRVFGEGEAGGEVVGREFEMAGRRIQVIGTVPNGRYASLGEDDRAFAFLPAAQWDRDRYSLFVHGPIDAEVLRREIEAELAVLVPHMPPPGVNPFADAAALSILPQRILGVAAAALGALALILASTGLYGLLAFQLERRFRELGIRRALGATSAQVATALLRRPLTWLGVGVVAGVLMAQLAVTALGDMLFGISGRNPVALGGVLLAFGVISAVALARPLQRLRRLEPMEALRLE